MQPPHPPICRHCSAAPPIVPPAWAPAAAPQVRRPTSTTFQCCFRVQNSQICIPQVQHSLVAGRRHTCGEGPGSQRCWRGAWCGGTCRAVRVCPIRCRTVHCARSLPCSALGEWAVQNDGLRTERLCAAQCRTKLACGVNWLGKRLVRVA